MRKYALIGAVALTALLVGVALSFGDLHKVTTVSASGHHGNCYGITVTGTGKIKVQPDFARISLNIETKAKRLEDAQRENAKTVKRVVTALNEQGIHDTDISTSWFNIYPDYDSHLHRQSGHRVSNQLDVKVRDIANLGKIIDLSTAAGATSVNGVQFGIENNTPPYNTALIKAIESAREKAFVLSVATELGDLRIISVKEVLMNHYGDGGYGYRYSSLDSASHTQIMRNEIEVTATVEVKFTVDLK